jgi:hypothetical protein
MDRDEVTDRLRWRDAKRYDNSLIYRIAIWRGWVHTPSSCLLGNCTYHWREQRKREKLRRKIG